ncbi:MAG: hypothetical protein QF632_03520 [Candidatus Woesearchaeota archaeon]|jgi:hypothetical protein|nr:hypothetical protein [Candidatus Woesearchaeota archaeon]MDP7457903.1 hypothetical protein [Candidatus Woesearchaeota archaeon]
MKFIDNQTIIIEYEPSDLDKFVIKFTKLLTKYSKYVIISGYVAILLGRNRSTDDVDILIPPLSKEEFEALHNNLLEKKYWSVQEDNPDELFDLLQTNHGIRYAIKPTWSPNIELKFTKSLYDDLSIRSPITVKIQENELKIGFLELQIAFKEEILKSNKDLEDAQQIRIVAKGHLNHDLIGYYKKELRKTL